MKGYNELTLNHQTMIEAVQYWLEAQMVGPAPRVTAVKPLTDSRFEIGLVVPVLPEQSDAE